MTKFLLCTAFLLFTGGSIAKAQGSPQFLEYYFKNINTVGKLKAAIEHSSLSESQKEQLLMPMKDSPGTKSLPKVKALDSNRFEITESGKTYLVQLNVDKAEAIINGKSVKMSEDFEKNYQALLNMKFAGTNPFAELVVSPAHALVQLGGWGYIVAAFAAWNICERRNCPNPLLAAFFAPTYLAWVAVDVILLGGEVRASTVTDVSVKCPQNNNGKFEYAVKTPEETKTYQISMSDGKPQNIVENIERPKKDKISTKYFVDPDWSVSKTEQVKSGTDLKKLSNAFKDMVAKCKSNPKEMESVSTKSMNNLKTQAREYETQQAPAGGAQ